MAAGTERSYWWYELFGEIWATACREFELRKAETGWFADFLRDLNRYSYLTWNDAGIILSIAIVFSVLRIVLSRFVFTPFAESMNFTPINVRKFPESAFKVWFYMAAWAYQCYILFWLHPEFFSRPISVWEGWHRGMPVSFEIYVIYMVEAGFYVHSIYGVFYLDARRKDTIMMCLHHLLTLFLITFSLAVRYVHIGLVVLFLHDVADICLEWGKIGMYLRSRGGYFHKLADYFSTLCFAGFSISWFVCRLYLYPHKVLHSTGHLSMILHPTGPFYFFFNAMLWALFCMNAYWFHFIVLAIIRMVCGQNLDDTREEQDEESAKSPSLATESSGKGGRMQSFVTRDNAVPAGFKGGDVDIATEEVTAGRSASQSVNRRLRTESKQT